MWISITLGRQGVLALSMRPDAAEHHRGAWVKPETPTAGATGESQDTTRLAHARIDEAGGRA